MKRFKNPENPTADVEEEKPEIIEINQSSMDFLNKFKDDLNALDTWLQNSKATVEKLGKAHLAGNIVDMREAQNQLWQSFQKEVWGKKLFVEMENLTDNSDSTEKRMLIEKIKIGLSVEEIFKHKIQKRSTTYIPADELRKNLYTQLEQHWMASEYLNEKKQPKKLDQFVFRISLWISDVIQIKHKVQELINQCQIKTS